MRLTRTDWSICRHGRWKLAALRYGGGRSLKERRLRIVARVASVFSDHLVCALKRVSLDHALRAGRLTIGL
jgi:hypothetical protein